MTNPVVFMFSGQGSHYYHMGKELFEQHPVFRKWMCKLDDTVRKSIGQSIVEHIYDEKKEKGDIFDRTLYSHPALFMVGYALSQVLVEEGIEPDYVLGASLGEFVAAAIAGVMSAEDILAAVIKHAEVVETHCRQGGMLAILDDPRLFYETSVFNNCELASVNFDSHFVVSGKKEQLAHVKEFLEEKDVICQTLPVSHAFHSTLMDPATPIYASYFTTKSFRPPRIPFISCTRADVVAALDAGHLLKVVRQPIEFQKTIQRLEKKQNYIYLDLGPSGTLATFVKYNLGEDSGSKSFALLTPFGQDVNNLKNVRESVPCTKARLSKMERGI